VAIIDEIYEFLSTCPFLRETSPYGFAVVNVDRAGVSPSEYSIEVTPATPWVKRFLRGHGVKQCVFVFASCEHFDESRETNAANLAFYEAFEDWLNGFRTYKNPAWRKLEALTSGYIYDVPSSLDRARYQIQCRLTYCV
jgi:hypothetical protein